MTIRHHLPDNLLMAYAAGNLPEAFHLVVATHLSLCDTCRVQAASFDAVGGALVDDLAGSAMSEGSLEACLARLEATPVHRRGPVARREGVFPAPLQDYVGGDLAAVRWKALGMGVKQAILPTGRGARARLLFIPAGAAVPDHGHRGTELTLVLQGAFRDETDRFGPGDVEVADEDLNHQPVAEAGMDCICLAATDAPLRFNALIPRILQPVFRI
ncbi:ChrR family anti-sigma-E factor [Neogemmobacter tilapiae]|uniref:Anti-sigma-E factor ChrR n=1 Tax=Neogemmobacter tilapiae TaxID=875041 RepID=A0A918WJ15_9RHOB|nr:ChrR family anti-sigma-E factor [Gemmobacter tilapiae]GHC56280.1 anti-sigma-E factor ChrR [Gemmobacter tilapiae]